MYRELIMTQVVSLIRGALIGVSHGPIEDDVDVIALHGWGRTRDDFRSLLIRPGVVAFDLPGFGSSPQPDEVWGAREYADLLADALVPIVERSGPVVMVGHSFGGRVAICLAAHHPHLVGGLLLIGVPLMRTKPSRPDLAFRLARWANKVGLYGNDQMERLRHRKGSADYRASTGVMRDIFVRVVNEDYTNELDRIECPTAFLWGCDDVAAPLAQAEVAAQRVGNLIELTKVHAGHDVHLSNPDEMERLIGLLKAVSRR